MDQRAMILKRIIPVGFAIACLGFEREEWDANCEQGCFLSPVGFAFRLDVFIPVP